MQIRDGWLLAKFLNYTVADTVDIRALNRGTVETLTTEEVAENLTLVLESARGLGILVSVTAEELAKPYKNPQKIIDLIWDLIRTQLLMGCGLLSHPELIRTLDQGADADLLMKLKPEEVLSTSRLES